MHQSILYKKKYNIIVFLKEIISNIFNFAFDWSRRSLLSLWHSYSLFSNLLSRKRVYCLVDTDVGMRYEVSIYRYNIGSEALFKADDSVAVAALG